MFKKKFFTVLVMTILTFNSFGQEGKDKKLIYRVGAGPSIEGNQGKWAINFMNELSVYTSERFSINPSLTYFAVIGEFDGSGKFWEPQLDGQNINAFSSSLFTDVRLNYDVIRTAKDFRVGLGFGPSFQYGGDASFGGWFRNERGEMEGIMNVERFARLGYVTQVVFDWQGKNENRRNTLGVSMSSFSGYWPYYLMVNYRLGFKLK
ncbi:hypothetical protein [Algoriphagus algorifonticola]|uniref:hypothetical protein n=1 Tax=Algoriphagus algorifonticola TaxID=2593007 RepID=UPI00119C9DA5|nr:hypothetical protein [Algoriphagus algorifonticola]